MQNFRRDMVIAENKISFPENELKKQPRTLEKKNREIAIMTEKIKDTDLA